ncbi:tellurite resistance TerB family protein [Aeromonas veronii]|uniref:tellurite resistance TerB family protein n=1 Tax=Aeromonas veronii TaxID=654 RepID=UPI0030067849
MKQMLEQLLGAGKGWLNEGGDKRKGQMQGALAGGALGLLLGNKKVRAMVAAARADGHIDGAERQKIQEYLTEQGQSDVARWIDAELARPLDPHALAREVTDMELATEVYLASLLAIEVDHFMERGYLDELARALKLDDNLKGSIERQVAQLNAPA